MGWLDLFGSQSSKIIKQVEARAVLEKKLSETPRIGEIATPKQRMEHKINLCENTNADRLSAGRKGRQALEEVRLSELLVIDGAKLECKFCTQMEGVLKVNYDTPTIQGKKTATLMENSFNSLIFKGNCTKSPNSSSPCAAVMNLGNWKDTGNMKVQNQPPLLLKSTIFCKYGQVDIKITDSGQINDPEMKVVGNLKDITIKGWEYAEGDKNEIPITVCNEVECKVLCVEEGKEVENKNIKWKVKVGEENFVNLEERKEIVGNSKIFTGNRICFLVPKEWGQKPVRFRAYLEGEASLESEYEVVRDHIVAAFYRINVSEPKPFFVKGVRKAKGTHNFISSAPVHHHQGLYREGDCFYVSGSTGWVPAYTYIIRNNGNNFEHIDTLLYEKDGLGKYKHPGGLQLANGILAVGMEEYEYGGAFVKNNSVVCFFKDQTELKHLRLVRPEGIPSISVLGTSLIENIKKIKEAKAEGDLASAVGIVYSRNKHEYIVAVRGKNQSVDLYKIDGELKQQIKAGRFEKVGEFQNMNLFLDEKDEVYLFGMADGDIGSVFRLIFSENNVVLESVCIEEGRIKYGNYITDKNKIKFKCKKPVSFHWASCVYLDRKSQEKELGFKGRFTVYSIGDVVKSEEYQDDIYDTKKEEEGIFFNSFTEK